MQIREHCDVEAELAKKNFKSWVLNSQDGTFGDALLTIKDDILLGFTKVKTFRDKQ